jgi:hypothetical protein
MREEKCMRKLLQLIAVFVVALSTVAVPALGAPPLPDAGINVAGSTEATAAASIHYGDSVAFDHWMDGKHAKKYYLTIGVHCTQDGVKAYEWYGQPDFAFPLGDQNASQWSWNGDSDATCIAQLRYFANNRLTVIAETSFGVYAAG